MKKVWKVILLIVAVLILISGFSLIGKGNIGPGLLGIVIAVLIAFPVIKKWRKNSKMPSKTMKAGTVSSPGQDEKSNQEARRQAYISKLHGRNFNADDVVVLDCETTGTDENKDEILQLSIIDGHGNTLFNELTKPVHRKKWTDAEAVNGITPELVKDKKPVAEYAEQIREILDGKTIVGYNIDFDYGFCREAGLLPKGASTKTQDVMKPFAWIYGEWDPGHRDYKWKKLSDCADYYHYEWDGSQHDSLADCKATLFCFKQIFDVKE